MQIVDFCKFKTEKLRSVPLINLNKNNNTGIDERKNAFSRRKEKD
jgi:hypothetical protein